MKVRNKETGEIAEFEDITRVFKFIGNQNTYSSLAEFIEEWEDYEEPKTFWAISWAGEPEEYDAKNTPEELKNMAKQIGNYFSSKEEAELAVRKLKAWKRLKDKGVKIIGYYCDGETNRKGEFSGEVNVTIDVPQEVDINIFYLLFGGEE
jgi:hypothetical protein